MPRLPARPFLYAIVDTRLLAGRSAGGVVAALARGGAAMIQLRAKEGSDAQRVRRAREAGAAARHAGVPFIVDDRVDIALIVGADGVHVGRDDVPPATCRQLMGPRAIVGLSTHDPAQVLEAAAAPVDYLSYGPVFPTRTKANPDPVVGLDGLRAIRPLVARPLVAIGGITRRNAAAIVSAGGDGAAVISDLMVGADVETSAREILAALRMGL